MKGQGNQRVGARKAKFSYEELRLTDSITDVATASIHTPSNRIVSNFL